MSDLKAQVLDKSLPPFKRLTLLMEMLRSPQGCNWDRKQTHETLLPYLIEETYEVVDSIAYQRYAELKEELGDLLCQVVFHAQLARERGEFDIDDAVTHLVDKLIRRHPHVFGRPRDLSPQEVRDQWEKIKVNSGEKPSVLSGLPRSMPALTMAFRMGEKAGGFGFDWSDPTEVMEKVEEELKELRQEIFSPSREGGDRIESEVGDLLFATASLARKLSVDPELALKRALDKFRRRFERMEGEIASRGGTFDEYTLEQLEQLWQELKRTE
ncbi:MAG TPA: nucleoside triphosphate pyrophosphohydrolase [Acidobacteriota bacterium]|nr:nucleoside triphosphate pyrophosphohydrolase [Acidobacteriota bacterium]